MRPYSALFGELAFDPDLPRSSERAADVDGAKLSPLLARLAGSWTGPSLRPNLEARSVRQFQRPLQFSGSGTTARGRGNLPVRGGRLLCKSLAKEREAVSPGLPVRSLTSRSVASSEIRECKRVSSLNFVAATEPSTALRVLIRWRERRRVGPCNLGRGRSSERRDPG